jgi:hypothetical protein
MLDNEPAHTLKRAKIVSVSVKEGLLLVASNIQLTNEVAG